MTPETKICGRCHQEKPLSEYSTNGKKGISYRCKTCSAEVSRGYYYRNRQRCIDAASKRITTRYRRNKEKMYEYKAQYGCKHCPENDPVCLDFHHPNPNKEYAIGQRHMMYTWEKLLLEIHKCDVVCSNCHRKLHAKLKRTGRPKQIT